VEYAIIEKVKVKINLVEGFDPGYKVLGLAGEKEVDCSILRLMYQRVSNSSALFFKIVNQFLD
jgi:hypothetical protein